MLWRDRTGAAADRAGRAYLAYLRRSEANIPLSTPETFEKAPIGENASELAGKARQF